MDVLRYRSGAPQRRTAKGGTMEPQDQELWLQRQAIELVAQHIQFESDPSVKAELIEELRSMVARSGSQIDRAVFGFEARQELMRLGLWARFYDSRPRDQQVDDQISYGHGRYLQAEFEVDDE